MAAQTKRAALYFDPDLHKALRLKAVETNQSLSELVNDAVKEALAEGASGSLCYRDAMSETYWIRGMNCANPQMAFQQQCHGRRVGPEMSDHTAINTEGVII